MYQYGETVRIPTGEIATRFDRLDLTRLKKSCQPTAPSTVRTQ